MEIFNSNSIKKLIIKYVENIQMKSYYIRLIKYIKNLIYNRNT